MVPPNGPHTEYARPGFPSSFVCTSYVNSAPIDATLGGVLLYNGAAQSYVTFSGAVRSLSTPLNTCVAVIACTPWPIVAICVVVSVIELPVATPRASSAD